MHALSNAHALNNQKKIFLATLKMLGTNTGI
jgi:hypothetical protein